MVNWPSSPRISESYKCKVNKQGTILFAMEGMGLVHFKTGFSVEYLARLAIARSSSLQQASEDFARRAAIPYAGVINAMKKDYPHGWKLITRSGGTAIPLVVVFFGMENGASKYILVGFRVNVGKRITIATDTASCPGRACEGYSNSKYGVIIGESKAAYRRIGGTDQGSFNRFQGRGSDMKMARRLIAIEEQSASNVVGGPISVVKVDAAGELWTSSRTTCQF